MAHLHWQCVFRCALLNGDIFFILQLRFVFIIVQNKNKIMQSLLICSGKYFQHAFWTAVVFFRAYFEPECVFMGILDGDVFFKAQNYNNTTCLFIRTCIVYLVKLWKFNTRFKKIMIKDVTCFYDYLLVTNNDIFIIIY